MVEQPRRTRSPTLAGGSSGREYRLRDLVAALDAAKDDDRVKAVALDLDGFLGGGQTGDGRPGRAVRRVRTAGKPVIAYAVGYTDDGYQLAVGRVGSVAATRSARWSSPARAARTSISRACSTSSE